ncbi:hypothetical protein QBC40DRAFT_286287 [Triangularia verruculosa]|uniref:Uncharacterized protein n=1 Tax=Triangularia verruculosa TaxID=2587418 RepID=A0AAN6XCJ7_9PEZI|nr:hypothetical protein QBC40DRAFT_286287 [Triangularia verruculosa]
MARRKHTANADLGYSDDGTKEGYYCEDSFGIPGPSSGKGQKDKPAPRDRTAKPRGLGISDTRDYQDAMNSRYGAPLPTTSLRSPSRSPSAFISRRAPSMPTGYTFTDPSSLFQTGQGHYWDVPEEQDDMTLVRVRPPEARSIYDDEGLLPPQPPRGYKSIRIKSHEDTSRTIQNRNFGIEAPMSTLRPPEVKISARAGQSGRKKASHIVQDPNLVNPEPYSSIHQREVDIFHDPSQSLKDISVRLGFDIEEDWNSDLEDFCRFRRLGQFKEAGDCFVLNLERFGTVPYIRVQLAEMLLSSGSLHAFRDLEIIPELSGPASENTVDEWNRGKLVANYTLLSLLSQRDTPEYILTAWRITENTLKALGKENQMGSTEIQLLILCLRVLHYIQICTHQVILGLATQYAEDLFKWDHLYSEMVAHDCIWDAKDLLVAASSVFGWQATSTMFFGTTYIPEVMKRISQDWSRSYFDEPSTLGLLDLYTSLILQEHTNETKVRDGFLLEYATGLAKTVETHEAELMRSRPFIQWLLAKSLLGVTTAQGRLDGLHLEDFQGLRLRQGSGIHLPIYIPTYGSQKPPWDLFVFHSTPEQRHAVEVAVAAAESICDYTLQSEALKLLAMMSPDPRQHMADLCRLQLEVQGDMEGCLATLLSSCLVANEPDDLRNLRKDLEKFDPESSDMLANGCVNTSLAWARAMLYELVDTHATDSSPNEEPESYKTNQNAFEGFRQATFIYGSKLPSYITEFIRHNFQLEIPPAMPMLRLHYSTKEDKAENGGSPEEPEQSFDLPSYDITGFANPFDYFVHSPSPFGYPLPRPARGNNPSRMILPSSWPNVRVEGWPSTWLEDALRVVSAQEAQTSTQSHDGGQGPQPSKQSLSEQRDGVQSIEPSPTTTKAKVRQWLNPPAPEGPSTTKPHAASEEDAAPLQTETEVLEGNKGNFNEVPELASPEAITLSNDQETPKQESRLANPDVNVAAKTGGPEGLKLEGGEAESKEAEVNKSEGIKTKVSTPEGEGNLIGEGGGEHQGDRGSDKPTFTVDEGSGTLNFPSDLLLGKKMTVLIKSKDDPSKIKKYVVDGDAMHEVPVEVQDTKAATKKHRVRTKMHTKTVNFEQINPADESDDSDTKARQHASHDKGKGVDTSRAPLDSYRDEIQEERARYAPTIAPTLPLSLDSGYHSSYVPPYGRPAFSLEEIRRPALVLGHFPGPNLPDIGLRGRPPKPQVRIADVANVSEEVPIRQGSVPKSKSSKEARDKSAKATGHKKVKNSVSKVPVPEPPEQTGLSQPPEESISFAPEPSKDPVRHTTENDDGKMEENPDSTHKQEQEPKQDWNPWQHREPNPWRQRDQESSKIGQVQNTSTQTQPDPSPPVDAITTPPTSSSNTPPKGTKPGRKPSKHQQPTATDDDWEVQSVLADDGEKELSHSDHTLQPNISEPQPEDDEELAATNRGIEQFIRELQDKRRREKQVSLDEQEWERGKSERMMARQKVTMAEEKILVEEPESLLVENTDENQGSEAAEKPEEEEEKVVNVFAGGFLTLN